MLNAGALLSLEQVGMRGGAHKDDGVSFQAIDQQEVATNVAFMVISPRTFEGVIQMRLISGRGF